MSTFSEVTITFNVDYEDTYFLRLSYRDSSGTITDQRWDWVVTRSAAFEVTEGTPTATAGERAAINFKAAFDLDNPTGYVTTQTLNSVTIASETEGEDFVGVMTGITDVRRFVQGEEWDVVFNNVAPTPSELDIDVAFVRSPYYITTDFIFDTTLSATIKLKVWEGDLITDEPNDYVYELTRTRPVTDVISLDTNIAEFLSEQFTDKDDITKWVKYEVIYNDIENAVSPEEGYLAALNGYGYYAEGANVQEPVNRILLSNLNKRQISGTFDVYYINNGYLTSYNLDGAGSVTITPTTDSADFVQKVSIDTTSYSNNDIITLSFSAALRVDIDFIVRKECVYDAKEIVFRNKYGVLEQKTFYAYFEEKLNVDKDEFNNNYTSSSAYNVGKHQYKDINLQGRESFIVNSGFVNQSENETFKQLLLSDEVYLGTIPINVASSDISFKTIDSDELINYQIEFKYAYNAIQNV